MISESHQNLSWPIKRALTIPILVLGTEKQLVVLNAMVCVVFAMTAHFSWPIFFIPLLFLLVHGMCMAISKHDPRMMSVFNRAKRYRGYFPANMQERSKYSRPFSAYPQGDK